jgi:hypothetical protein
VSANGSALGDVVLPDERVAGRGSRADHLRIAGGDVERLTSCAPTGVAWSKVFGTSNVDCAP